MDDAGFNGVIGNKVPINYEAISQQVENASVQNEEAVTKSEENVKRGLAYVLNDGSHFGNFYYEKSTNNKLINNYNTDKKTK